MTFIIRAIAVYVLLCLLTALIYRLTTRAKEPWHTLFIRSLIHSPLPFVLAMLKRQGRHRLRRRTEKDPTGLDEI